MGDWHSVAYGESTFVAPKPGDPDVTLGSGYFSIFLSYDMASRLRPSARSSTTSTLRPGPASSS